MSQWVRNAVMLVALGVWAVVVLFILLVKQTPPDPVTWGFLGGLYFLLNPTLPRRPAPPPADGEAAS